MNYTFFDEAKEVMRGVRSKGMWEGRFKNQEDIHFEFPPLAPFLGYEYHRRKKHILANTNIDYLIILT